MLKAKFSFLLAFKVGQLMVGLAWRRQRAELGPAPHGQSCVRQAGLEPDQCIHSGDSCPAGPQLGLGLDLPCLGPSDFLLVKWPKDLDHLPCCFPTCIRKGLDQK